MIPNQLHATISAILLALGIMTAQYIKIQYLKTDIANLNTTVVNKLLAIEKLETTNKNLKSSIGVQNEAIDNLAVDKATLDKKLAEWKSKPAEVRYEVIYKIREVKSDECKDIKDSINVVRSLDFDSL